MYAYNHRAGTPAQAYAPAAHTSTSAYGINPAYVPPLGTTAGANPAPMPVPAQVSTAVSFPSSARHTPTPPAPALPTVQVPQGCYPIELVQFWRTESRHPLPLHWALFVRTAPVGPSVSPTTRARAAPGRTPMGNFYELVGSTETYTAQFLAGVTFSPETLPDWRGTHVIGWVHPAQLGTFERVVRQVPVWRRRADWRCQTWAYEVVCALGGCEGVWVQRCEWGGVQRQMGWLLEAWENGDI